MTTKRFNIRVYGLLINSKQEILISDECRNGHYFTKFPGGGLEWGEGIQQCLIREFEEELSIAINVGAPYYCTDFFIRSAFNPADQLISMYYHVDYSQKDALAFAPYERPFAVEQEKFRWVSLSEIHEDEFTFPIDKLVAKKLREEN